MKKMMQRRAHYSTIDVCHSSIDIFFYELQVLGADADEEDDAMVSGSGSGEGEGSDYDLDDGFINDGTESESQYSSE